MGGRRGPRPLLHLRGTFGDSRHRLQSALSTLLGDGGEHVQTDVPCARSRLRGQRGARIVQPTRAGDARSTGMSPYRPRVTCCTWNSALRRAAAGSQKSKRPLPAELERLTYVLPINSDTLAKRTTQAAYVLILVWA